MVTPQDLDIATAAYNEVWQGWSGIDAGNVDLVRRAALKAAFRAKEFKDSDGGIPRPADHVAFHAVCDTYETVIAAASQDYFEAVEKTVDGELTYRAGIEVVSKLIASESRKNVGQ